MMCHNHYSNVIIQFLFSINQERPFVTKRFFATFAKALLEVSRYVFKFNVSIKSNNQKMCLFL